MPQTRQVKNASNIDPAKYEVKAGTCYCKTIFQLNFQPSSAFEGDPYFRISIMIYYKICHFQKFTGMKL